MKKLDRSGFTLLELLLVIAIISILAGISVPVYMSAKGRAKQAVNLDNIRSAITLAGAEMVSGEQVELYYMYDTASGVLVPDEKKNYETLRNERADLKKEVYKKIFVKIQDDEILTWPELPDEEEKESGAGSSVQPRELAEELTDGRYEVKPGDFLFTDGKWYRYVGTKEMTVDGPETKKGKRYWKEEE